MPDVRLDAVDDAIEAMGIAWAAIVVDAKASATPREANTILDAGMLTMTEHLNTVNSLLQTLPVKDIAIDLHTPAS